MVFPDVCHRDVVNGRAVSVIDQSLAPLMSLLFVAYVRPGEVLVFRWWVGEKRDDIFLHPSP